MSGACSNSSRVTADATKSKLFKTLSESILRGPETMQSVSANLSDMSATVARAETMEGGRGCFMVGKLKGEN